MSTTSSAKAIAKIIDKLPVTMPIVMKKYTRLASSEDNLRKIFSRFMQSGKLEKIVTGIYCKPRMVKTYKIYPAVNDIARAISEQTGEKIVIFGADAIRLLGLSTQITVKPVFYTSGQSRTIKVGNNDIKFENINSKFINTSSTIQLILSAAYYLGKDKFTLDDLDIVEQNINLITQNDKSFNAILLKCETIKVKWVSKLLADYARQKGLFNAVTVSHA